MASSDSAPILPPSRPIPIDVSSLPADAASSSLWDRISSWASENKALVYTIAGVTLVVTAAGVVYYTTSSDVKASGAESSSGAGKAKANKKAKRKAKKEAEEKAKVEEEEKAKTGGLRSAIGWMDVQMLMR
jgi:import receptor subunit TOM70